jgi:hypothetical protein
VVLTGPSTLERSGRFDLLRSWLNTGMELRLGLWVCGQLTWSYCVLSDRCGMWQLGKEVAGMKRNDHVLWSSPLTHAKSMVRSLPLSHAESHACSEHNNSTCESQQ